MVKKWSQEEFAHISGFHRTYIGQIERGEKNISFSNLAKISSVLGVTLSEMLAGLEAGDKPIAKSMRGGDHKDQGIQGMKIHKLVRQLRTQQAAVSKAMNSLEELVLPASSSTERPLGRRRAKRGSGKG